MSVYCSDCDAMWERVVVSGGYRRCPTCGSTAIDEEGE